MQYINNESRRFKTYVANRVSEIKEVSKPSQWRPCPGLLNPADDASRGLSAQKFVKSERWFRGPAFLSKPPEEWPEAEIGELPKYDPEVKNEKPIFLVKISQTLQTLLQRYSSWTLLKRRVAWLLKFVSCLQCRKAKSLYQGSKYLTAADLEKATIAIVKLIQREVYPNEVKDLEDGRAVKCSSKIVKLCPLLDDGILRVGGRVFFFFLIFIMKQQKMFFFSAESIPPGARCPMILPPKHHVTQLLITAYHQKLAHAGQNHILALLRERFWIPKGRSAVRNIVRACKKQRGARMKQMMATLPPFRTTAYEPCFTHTGVDYFGSLNVKKGRAVVKRWGALFTCLNSRAVHLELATSLESDDFINFLRRFINRRGPPKFMYSDNGTNFVDAEREMLVDLLTPPTWRPENSVNIRNLLWLSSRLII